VRHTAQTGAGLGRQRAGFHAHGESRFGTRGRGSGRWSGESAGGQFARHSPSRAEYGDVRSLSFEMERRNGPRSSFRGYGLPPVIEGWFPHSGYHGGIRGGSLVREMVWIVLTPLWSKWLGTGFTLLVLTLHVLVFEFQVGDLKNIWLIDSGCSRHMTGDKGSV
jgi:hypothetical protein